MKVKSITKKHPLIPGGIFLRSAEEDVLLGQLEDLSLLDNLVRTEELVKDEQF